MPRTAFSNPSRKVNLRLLQQMVVPLVQWGLKRGVSAQDFMGLVKGAYIQVAERELGLIHAHDNVSRVSALTGLHREEIKRISKTQGKELVDSTPKSIPARVLVLWEQSRRFRGSGQREMKDLTTEELHELVTKVSSALSPATVVFELERTGAIKHADGKWRLIRGSHSISPNAERAYAQVADDISSLLAAVEGNLRVETAEGGFEGNLHHKTVFDNIFVSSLPEIRLWLLREGREFHRRLRSYLAERDADLGEPRAAGERAGSRVVVGMFSDCHEPQNELSTQLQG